MKTLIELYDERSIENVIGPETFRPEKIVYMCPEEVVRDKVRQEGLRRFFAHRGLEAQLEFVACSKYKTDSIYNQFKQIATNNGDCAMDVTGGSDAALFAAGQYCNESGMPTFTYSRKRNKFYNISNADFAHDVECALEYNVEDFFMMAGGTLRKGRVDNNILGEYMDKYDEFFDVFEKNRRHWARDISFMQRISRSDYEGNYSLDVEGSYEQKGEHGGRIKANEPWLHELERIGFIKNLHIETGQSVKFTFADDQIRSWLRDVGSVLELYMYKTCKDTGIFRDVISSAIVDWDGTNTKDSISNEIDVVATRGVVPLFISCKATEVKTEAINELAILRDRFGGKGAKATIVSTENCNAAARHRAAQMGIVVIDKEEIENGTVGERLKIIMKVAE